MKLIQKGQAFKDRSTLWKCNSCNSIYEAQMFEGRYFTDQRDGDCVIFTCPNCRTENWVSVDLFK